MRNDSWPTPRAVEGLQCEVLTREGASAQMSLLCSGEGWREDVAAAVAEFAEASAVARLPVAEMLDALYEAANDALRSGQPLAFKLMTAHGAKGLEFRQVVVMDCAVWRLSGEDERRLL